MSPEDPRHKSVAGYRAGCRLDCCKRAMAGYNQMRKLRLARGQRTGYLPSLGTARRLQALVTLGYSARRISMLMGKDPSYVRLLLQREGGQVSERTAAEVDKVYRRLCMTPAIVEKRGDQQSITLAKRIAAHHGWAPPLAWDDIDIDLNPIRMSEIEAVAVDEVAVERALGGDFHQRLERAERREVTRRWGSTGRSLAELERLSGWNVARYVRLVREEDAA